MTTKPPRITADPLGLRGGGEGAITGTVVCASAIAYGAGHLDSLHQVVIAIVGTVGVYWLAHLHAETIGHSLANNRHPLLSLRHALAETLPLVAASVLPLVVLLVASLFGATLRNASWAALLTTIGLLAAYSYLAGVRGGLDVGGRIASAATGAGIGVLVVLLKVALH